MAAAASSPVKRNDPTFQNMTQQVEKKGYTIPVTLSSRVDERRRRFPASPPSVPLFHRPSNLKWLSHFEKPNIVSHAQSHMPGKTRPLEYLPPSRTPPIAYSPGLIVDALQKASRPKRTSNVHCATKYGAALWGRQIQPISEIKAQADIAKS